MDFRELEYMVEIARCGSLTGAAQSLYVSQPTLTKCVQRIEDSMGISLFSYVGRKMVPTYAGECYLRHAKKLLSEKQLMEQEIQEILLKDKGLLTVGMPPFRCSFTLPEVLPEFRKRYPNVKFSIFEADSSELDAALLSGQIDVAFFHHTQNIKGLQYRSLFHDWLNVIVPKDHPLAVKGLQTGSIALSDLNGHTLLLQGRSQRHGQFLRALLQEHHVVPGEVMESKNIRATASLAAAGYGIAFISGDLSRHWLDHDSNYYLFPLSDCDAALDMVAAWREGHAPNDYAEAFISLVQKIYQEQIGRDCV